MMVLFVINITHAGVPATNGTGPVYYLQ